MTNDEIATERRLEREALTTNLGYVRHASLSTGDGVERDIARVEVTYQRTEDDVEHCGFLTVAVPSFEPTGDEEHDMANHPATLAQDAAHAWGEEKGFVYFSVDEVNAY
jgi:hypothetical protein